MIRAYRSALNGQFGIHEPSNRHIVQRMTTRPELIGFDVIPAFYPTAQALMVRKQRREVNERLAKISDTEQRLILATGSYIGEGFDDARLDTLFLAMPISWKRTLQQYVDVGGCPPQPESPDDCETTHAMQVDRLVDSDVNSA